MDKSVATNAFDVVAGHSFGGFDETEVITDPINMKIVVELLYKHT